MTDRTSNLTEPQEHLRERHHLLDDNQDNNGSNNKTQQNTTSQQHLRERHHLLDDNQDNNGSNNKTQQNTTSQQHLRERHHLLDDNQDNNNKTQTNASQEQQHMRGRHGDHANDANNQVNHHEQQQSHDNNATHHDGAKEPIIMAYFPNWYLYNPAEPTAFPGYYNDSNDQNSAKRLENAANIEKLLPNVNSVVYSFLEIKQNDFQCTDQIKAFTNCHGSKNQCLAEAKKVACQDQDHSLTYDSNKNNAGNVTFLDAWADFRVEGEGRYSAKKIHSDEQLSIFPEKIYNTWSKKLTNFDISKPEEFFHYGSFDAFANYNKTPFHKMIAIGGFGDPDNSGVNRYLAGWKAAADNPENFAETVVALAKEFHLEGVDLDWEPLSSISDKQYGTDPTNMIKIAKAVHDQAASKGLKDFQINFPITVDQKQIEAFDKSSEVTKFKEGGVWSELMKYVDHINIMGYDMHGGFDKGTNSGYTGLHSALYPVEGDHSGFSIDGAVQTLNKLGVSSEKMILGVPGYGRGVDGVKAPGLNQEFSGNAWGLNDSAAGVTSYKGILKLIDEHHIKVEHPKTSDGKINGAYINFDDKFISFDDIESIKEKVHYAQEHNMAGVMMWDLTNDQSGDKSLLKTIHDEYYHNNDTKSQHYTDDSSSQDLVSMHDQWVHVA